MSTKPAAKKSILKKNNNNNEMKKVTTITHAMFEALRSCIFKVTSANGMNHGYWQVIWYERGYVYARAIPTIDGNVDEAWLAKHPFAKVMEEDEPLMPFNVLHDGGSVYQLQHYGKKSVFSQYVPSPTLEVVPDSPMDNVNRSVPLITHAIFEDLRQKTFVVWSMEDRGFHGFVQVIAYTDRKVMVRRLPDSRKKTGLRTWKTWVDEKAMKEHPYGRVVWEDGIMETWHVLRRNNIWKLMGGNPDGSANGMIGVIRDPADYADMEDVEHAPYELGATFPGSNDILLWHYENMETGVY